jgi:hypothetical protein
MPSQSGLIAVILRMNCSPNKAKNQWIENPFIGKVKPPFGPWKDKITIAEMGPYKNSTNSPKKEANQ